MNDDSRGRQERFLDSGTRWVNALVERIWVGFRVENGDGDEDRGFVAGRCGLLLCGLD